VPLLKDMFGSERRKAKVLNFSIAYGKTAHGLARDWGTSREEAEETVQKWYADRPEVRAAPPGCRVGLGYPTLPYPPLRPPLLSDALCLADAVRLCFKPGSRMLTT